MRDFGKIDDLNIRADLFVEAIEELIVDIFHVVEEAFTTTAGWDSRVLIVENNLVELDMDELEGLHVEIFTVLDSHVLLHILATALLSHKGFIDIQNFGSVIGLNVIAVGG